MHFNRRLIFKVVSVILLFEGIAMIIPFLFACYYRELTSATSFFCTMVVCISFGETMRRVLPKTNKSLQTREGYLIVLLSWLFVILVGAMPYLLASENYSFIACFFESCAGWTTTGCTCLGLEAMPKSLVLWKVITGWLGGMGIILLTISIFPRLGIGGQKMAAAEMPGPEIDKLTARFGDTARISYRVYVVLTVVAFLLLLPSGIGVYHSLINALSSISTSGMIDMTAAQTNFHVTPYVKLIVTLFSLLGGSSFMVFYLFYHRKFHAAVNHYEIRNYYFFVGVTAMLIASALFTAGNYTDVFHCVGDSLVQAIAFATTTGFTIVDLSKWPTFAKILLLILMLVGGCGFSTSGGLKMIRLIVFLKLIIRGVYKRIHPQAIKPIMLQGKPVSAALASSMAMFLLLYFAILVSGFLIMGLENLDMETTCSVVAACFTTNGTAFGQLTNHNFAIISDPGKLVLCVLMLAGRLEMYTVVLMFTRSYWNIEKAR